MVLSTTPINFNQPVHATLTGPRSEETYKVHLQNPADLAVDLYDLTADLDVQVLDSHEKLILFFGADSFGGANEGTLAEHADFMEYGFPVADAGLTLLKPGDYLVKVKSKTPLGMSGKADYTLKVSDKAVKPTHVKMGHMGPKDLAVYRSVTSSAADIYDVTLDEDTDIEVSVLTADGKDVELNVTAKGKPDKKGKKPEDDLFTAKKVKEKLTSGDYKIKVTGEDGTRYLIGITTTSKIAELMEQNQPATAKDVPSEAASMSVN